MFAIRQIINDPCDVISVPIELRYKRTEVIFIAMEEGEPHLTSPPADAIEAFRGKGKGGVTARLLTDRRLELAREKPKT